MVKSLVYKKWQTWAIIREILNSNLETGRYSPNLESPGLSRRVDSTNIEVTSTAQPKQKLTDQKTFRKFQPEKSLLKILGDLFRVKMRKMGNYTVF